MEAHDKFLDSKKGDDWLFLYKKNITSQNGEDGIIEKIFETIEEENKWCVEFGAGDGKTISNVCNLITNKGWSGVLIEREKRKYKKLVNNYKNRANVICLRRSVSFDCPDTLDEILKETPVPECFDILLVDIDGNDYHVWESVKLYKPRVVLIEFNPSMGCDIEFVQDRDLRINHGSSLLSLAKLGKEKGYELIAATCINAFFVQKEYLGLFGIKDNSPASLYKDKQFETRLIQLYDGTLLIRGCNKLIWHDIEIKQKDVQILPRAFIGYPPRLKFILFLLLTLKWKRFFSYLLFLRKRTAR